MKVSDQPVNGRSSRTAVILHKLPLWVAVLRDLVERTGVSVAGTARESGRALELVRELRPSIFLTEIGDSAEGVSLEFVEDVCRTDPDVNVIVISQDADPEHISGAFAAGAYVYALKSADPNDLAASIRQVFEPSYFIAPQRTASATNGHSNGNGASLTRRELQTLQLVAEGHTNNAVASRLWVTEQTVKFHLSNIYRKLHVANRTEASRWAQLHGVVSSAPAGTQRGLAQSA